MVTGVSEYSEVKRKRAFHQWRRQNFSAAGLQPGHQNLDWAPSKNFALLPYF